MIPSFFLYMVIYKLISNFIDRSKKLFHEIFISYLYNLKVKKNIFNKSSSDFIIIGSYIN